MNEGARNLSSRKSQRFAPTRPVTVVMSKDGASFAYGVVANISEGGACFQTNVVPRHQILDLLLSFYNGEYVQTMGRVVWSDSEEGAATIGVEFTWLTEQARHNLWSNLASGEFTQL